MRLLKSKLSLLMLWMSVMPLLTSASISVYLLNHHELLSSFDVWQWAILFLLAVFSMGFAITPTTFLALLFGFFLGFEALLPMVLAYQCASVLGYSLARSLDANFIEELVEQYPKSQKIVNNVHDHQFKLTLLSRLSPALPFAIMNVVLSVSGIRLRNFFWGGLLGMLPRTIFFIWMGKSAADLNEAMDSSVNIYISIGLSVVIIAFIYKLLKD